MVEYVQDNGHYDHIPGASSRRQIAAKLVDGYRMLENNVYYQKTDIALGYLGTKYAKGIGVVPAVEGTEDNFIVYSTSSLNVTRFYAVADTTAKELTDIDLNVRRVVFEVWGSVDGTNFTQIARADKIRAYVISEFDLDITGYNFIKLVVKMDSTSDSNTSCAVAWGDACFYSVDETPAHTCTPTEAVKENEKAPTCNANGSYDSVVYCSGCGDSTTEAHSYTNNACVCGHTLVDMIIDSSATLKAMLQLDFNVTTSKLSGTDNYAVITHTYADGTTDVVTVPQSQWGSNGKQASYSKIAAKEMGDAITIVIYNAKGQQLSIPETDSIKAYAYRGLEFLAKYNTGSMAKLRTLLVDMLNYGAAAQIQFKYDTNNLVNADMTETQKSWATKNDVVLTNHQQKDAATYNTALTLKSAIQMDFIFYANKVGTSSTWANRYAIVTYYDHYNKLQTLRIEGSDFVKYNNGNTYVQISAIGMAVADYQSIVTCVVYDTDGNALATAVDSMESYAYRALASGRAGETLENLCKALMKFSASAAAYFTK